MMAVEIPFIVCKEQHPQQLVYALSVQTLGAFRRYGHALFTVHEFGQRVKIISASIQLFHDPKSHRAVTPSCLNGTDSFSSSCDSLSLQ